MLFDAAGQPLASTFADYLLPGAPEVPAARIVHMETASPYTEFGAKGIGEGGAIAPPAAIANAVNDALRPLGVELRHSPITPRRIVEAVLGARSIATERKAAVMKPARFVMEGRATSPPRSSMLAGAEGTTKIMAGGQSLGPMLNLRLVEPDRVVDISGAAGAAADRPGGRRARHRRLRHPCRYRGRPGRRCRERHDGRASPRGIAYRAVRNRGTIGGSLAHADPAADWVSALSALGGRGRDRLARPKHGDASRLANSCSARSTWRWRADELVTAVRVPALPPSARWGYVKHCRKVGEFAEAIGAVVIDPERGCGRAVIGAVEAAPVVIEDARILFGGAIGPSFAARFDAAGADAAAGRGRR